MNKLRVLRAERNLPQYQLARLSEIEPTRFWRIEKELVAPTPEERRRIAAALGVSPRRIWSHWQREAAVIEAVPLQAAV